MSGRPKTSLKNLTSGFGTIPTRQNEVLQSLGKPHIDSFNWVVDEGLDLAVSDLSPAYLDLDNNHYKFWISGANIRPPTVPMHVGGVKNVTVWPTECRQRADTYSGTLTLQIEWEVNGVRQIPFEKDGGMVPIMVKSELCHLHKLDPAALVKHSEHEEEWGGYFIVKGHEKLVRMLLMTRRNYPVAVKRSTWKMRGKDFSEMGVSIRCVTADQTSTQNNLHFVNDGTVRVMFRHNKTQWFTPLILLMKCLVNLSDEAIFKRIMEGYNDDLYMKSCILNMLRSLHMENIHSQQDALDVVANTFHGRFHGYLPGDAPTEDVSHWIIKRCVLIHLDNYEDKFNCLVFMTQKLFCFVAGKTVAEGVDGVMMQELLLPGHLYLQVLKEKLSELLTKLTYYIVRRKKESKKLASMTGVLTHTTLSPLVKLCGTVEAPMQAFLGTGNISSKSGLGLMQNTGLVIIAENISRMRYMSHFRSVHRGSFFQEMRTTEARQLLPDAWGFICPVHTPDGAPCGLLNHLTKECQVTNAVDPNLLAKLPYVLASLGMVQLDHTCGTREKSYVVMLDGRVIGRVPQRTAPRLVDKLRMLKIDGSKVPKTLEIVLVPFSSTKGQHPGLFLFTGPARMMRPVMNLVANRVELIGTFEQVYLDICISRQEEHKGVTTHQELSKTGFLSHLASLIPMPDCNQSPRNMYQCQMSKQTMGTPCHNFQVQSETKLYRLQTPSSPLFRPSHYDAVQIDDFAMGTNSVVAVISYTGYDMEDAMIINKASLERGFAHGSILKTEIITLDSPQSYFALDPAKTDDAKILGEDGLPHPGQRIVNGLPWYSFYDSEKSSYVTKKFTGEYMIVDQVKLCGSLSQRKSKIANGPRAIITYRVPRNPMIGDKFASRAGQKGICSQLLPTEDLPFTESGIVPDIVFNPHGFPSRMTIAMMIECMAGKAAAQHGLVFDATPFEFSEEDTAIDYFGRLLHQGGFNYFGTERMYSGINGCEMTANIFFGIVYYQRLRHMVSDKWQVRSTGPQDILTHQPVKGRKRGGGVRFGEMERDSLISHGASFLLQDRLFHCSDKSEALICRTCGTILGPVLAVYSANQEVVHHVKCRLCLDRGCVEKIEIPFIFRYLVSQLASVNIKLQLELDCNA